MFYAYDEVSLEAENQYISLLLVGFILFNNAYPQYTYEETPLYLIHAQFFNSYGCS